MDPGRGYNVFSGMDAGQISNMNKTMGLSNMTALPPVNPALSGMGLKPGEPTSRTFMIEGDLDPGSVDMSDVSQSNLGDSLGLSTGDLSISPRPKASALKG